MVGFSSLYSHLHSSSDCERHFLRESMENMVIYWYGFIFQKWNCSKDTLGNVRSWCILWSSFFVNLESTRCNEEYSYGTKPTFHGSTGEREEGEGGYYEIMLSLPFKLQRKRRVIKDKHYILELRCLWRKAL